MWRWCCRAVPRLLSAFVFMLHDAFSTLCVVTYVLPRFVLVTVAHRVGVVRVLLPLQSVLLITIKLLL
jgi:hypothetical protein